MHLEPKFLKLCSNFVLSNLPVIIALIMLGSLPILILLHHEDNANQNAGYAFYFLIVGVLWKIVQYLMGKYLHQNEISSKKLAS
jgi:hypothetical protein